MNKQTLYANCHGREFALKMRNFAGREEILLEEVFSTFNVLHKQCLSRSSQRIFNKEKAPKIRGESFPQDKANC